MTLIISANEKQGESLKRWIIANRPRFDFPQDGDSFQHILEMNSKTLAKKSGFVIQERKVRKTVSLSQFIKLESE
jgi:hypothetical protein